MARHLTSTALAGLVAVAAQASPAPCPSPAVPPLSASELAQNGAVVRTATGMGMGFVVGWNQGEAWVAIPAHVVFGDNFTPSLDERASAAAKLDIRLRGDSEPRRLCRDKAPTPPPQGTVDLSFVCVEWVGRPFFNDGVLARKVAVGEEITLVDFENRQQGRGEVTTIENRAGVRGDLEAGKLGGVPGQSGALTASERGLVGLYLGQGDSGRYSILSMTAVHSWAGVAKIPWKLVETEYYDCAARRKVCATAETEIAPARVELRNVHAAAIHTLEANSCAPVPEGRYEILPAPPELTCEPKVLSVYAKAEDLRLALRCAVKLMGTWVTDAGEELLCVETQMGSAQCSGLSGQGLGIFVGSINAGTPGLSILGSFLDGAGKARLAKGSLRFTGGRLVGEIRRELEPPRALSLKRKEGS